jgi:putative hydrolase of the HAD superfamily
MRVIFWDFDGTLGYRDGGAWTASCWEVLQKEEPGCQVSQAQLRPYMLTGFPWHQPEKSHTHIQSAKAWWKMCKSIIAGAFAGVGFTAERARELAGKFRGIYLQMDRWRVYEDVIPVLDILAARRWTHVILSNHVPELGDILRYLDMEQYFFHIFNSAETGYEKPNVKAFQIAVDALPDLDVAWMVGDNFQADVEGALNAGIPAILVRRFHPGAQYFAETLNGVPAILHSAVKD